MLRPRSKEPKIIWHPSIHPHVKADFHNMVIVVILMNYEYAVCPYHCRSLSNCLILFKVFNSFDIITFFVLHDSSLAPLPSLSLLW